MKCVITITLHLTQHLTWSLVQVSVLLSKLHKQQTALILDIALLRILIELEHRSYQYCLILFLEWEPSTLRQIPTETHVCKHLCLSGMPPAPEKKPTPEYIRNFIRIYLEELAILDKKDVSSVIDKDIETYFVHTIKCMLVCVRNLLFVNNQYYVLNGI